VALKDKPLAVLPRGRIANWDKAQLDRLSTIELRALLENAERLKETEVAALCRELIEGRRRVRRAANKAAARP
jgi:uncharacterized protein